MLAHDGGMCLLFATYEITIALDESGAGHHSSLFGRLSSPGSSSWGEGMNVVYVGRYPRGNLFLRFYVGTDTDASQHIELAS